MAYTISLHNGTFWSRQHNIRGAGLAEKEAHIDQNGYRKAFIDIPLKQSYFETFGLAVQEYNAKQKRIDRHIVDYLTKVREEHKRSPTKKPHASYEMILTIGNRDHHPTSEEAEKAFKTWLDGFQKDNPNVVVFGAYFHDDEPDAAPHMHLDYYFIKRENKRGLSLQVSQNGALNEMGYFPIKENGKMVTPQTQFIRDSREKLREVAKEQGLDVELTTKGGKSEHLETELFKKKTELKKTQSKVKKVKSELKVWDSKVKEAKAEELRSRQKAQRNESRRQEAEKELTALQAKIEAKEKELTELNQDDRIGQLEIDLALANAQNRILQRQNGVLKKAIRAVEAFCKDFTIGNSSFWQKAKDFVKDKLGLEDNKEFDIAMGYNKSPQRNDGFDR